MALVWILWSLVAWPIAFALMGLIVLASWPWAHVVPFKSFQARWPAWLMGRLPQVSFSKVTVDYAPGFDPARRSVFVQNHVSMFDAHIGLRVIPGLFCGVENAAHYKVPFYGWLMREGGSIPIYPGRPGQAERLVEDARDRIARGYSILLFPEGHRTRDGKMRPFKRGGFAMARALELPLVPIAVRGLYDVLPKGRFSMRPGHIHVWVGPQLETAGLDDAGLTARIDELHALMSAFVATGITPPIDGSGAARAPSVEVHDALQPRQIVGENALPR